MARPGVTYSEVAAAAAQLMGQGRNPTVEQVRLVIGSGSSTTIANHLKLWRNEQEGTRLLAAKENLPQELVDMVKGLWERVVTLSQEKLNTAELEFKQLLNEQGEELLKYKNNNQRWQQLFNQWSQEKERLLGEISTLNEGIQSQKNDLAKQAGLLNAKTQQCTEKEDRIQELHRLHTQTQANLEHFREAARAQRDKEHQQFEHERQTWLVDNKRLNESLSTTKIQCAEAEQRLRFTENNYQQLSAKFVEIEAQCKAYTEQLNITEKALNSAQQNSLQIEKQLHHAQTELDAKTIKLIDTESTIKFLTQESVQTKNLISELQDQNKWLAQEKWRISEEYAGLLGQMKQLDKHFKSQKNPSP